MAKKLTKTQRQKVYDEMWNMLVMANQGYAPSVLNDGDPDIVSELGVEPWLNWVDALRTRYANHSALQYRFVANELRRFMEFYKAHEQICVLIERQAHYVEQDAAKLAS